MLPDITEEHIQEVIAAHTELSETVYWKEKRKRFSFLVPGLSEEATWLLTFSVWFCVFNFRFNKVDESRFYNMPPQGVNKVAFTDFLKVIQHYNRLNITLRREKPLVEFLLRCDKSHYDFYMALMSKSFIKVLPLTEVQKVLDLDSIEVGDVYGPIQLLKTDFTDLEYPVAITSLATPVAPLSVSVKEASRYRSFQLQEGKFTKVPDAIFKDRPYINTPIYTLVGYADILQACRNKQVVETQLFYPVDYFDSLKQYHSHLRDLKVPVPPFPERVGKLRKFLKDNYLTQIKSSYVGFAEKSSELLPEILKVVEDNEETYVVLSDKNTSKTGIAFAVDVRTTQGIIEDYWIAGGEALGFRVWFNGHLFNCTYNFSGRNSALLNNIHNTRNKPLKFVYIKVGEHLIGIGKEILWHTLPWRPRRRRFSAIRFEKCVLCGSADNAHTTQGLCAPCEINLRYHFARHEIGEWIEASRGMIIKRRRECWEPQMLNAAGVHFQGTYLEAREDGSWRFVEDAARKEKYLEWKANNG
jgi:hypothetical protein